MATDGNTLPNHTRMSPDGLRENKLRNGHCTARFDGSDYFGRVSVIFDVKMRLILGSSGNKCMFIPLLQSSTTNLAGVSTGLSIFTPEIGSLEKRALTVGIYERTIQ